MGRFSVRGAHATVAWFAAVAVLNCASPQSTTTARLEMIRARGYVGCGVHAAVTGFASIDSLGHYSGFDVDICRAVAAAIFNDADRVHFVEAPSVSDFLDSENVDIISRRISWTLEREGSRLQFGPVSFFDGQGFLVPERFHLKTVNQLSGLKICIVPGHITEFNLVSFFRSNHLELQKVALQSVALLDRAFQTGLCDAFSGDFSELGSARVGLTDRNSYEIMDAQISKEPLAQLVRSNDVAFLRVLRWTVYALVAAEEFGVGSKNLEVMEKSDDLEVKRLLGVVPGNGRSLGLDERWAYNIIRTVGNYGELYERNLGSASQVRLPRRLNALWTAGGLMYAPLFQP